MQFAVRVVELQLQLQGRGPLLLLPEAGRLAPPAASLFRRRLSPHPAQGFQLFAVAKAGLQITVPGCLLQPLGQLLLPPVGRPEAGGHQAQGEAQPETGQPVAAQGQGKREVGYPRFMGQRAPRPSRGGSGSGVHCPCPAMTVGAQRTGPSARGGVRWPLRRSVTSSRSWPW